MKNYPNVSIEKLYRESKLPYNDHIHDHRSKDMSSGSKESEHGGNSQISGGGNKYVKVNNLGMAPKRLEEKNVIKAIPLGDVVKVDHNEDIDEIDTSHEMEADDRDDNTNDTNGGESSDYKEFKVIVAQPVN